jgi:hypothetical protein
MLFTSEKRILILILAAIVIGNVTSVCNSTPDIVAPMPSPTSTAASLRLQAYKCESSQHSNKRAATWESLGIPKLVETYEAASEMKKTFKFESTSGLVTLGMEFLTSQQRLVLAEKANEKHVLSTISPEQFTQTPIDKLQCLLTIVPDSDVDVPVEHKSLVSNLSQFPIKLQFNISSENERTILRQLVHSDDLILKCEIHSQSLMRKFILNIKNNEAYFIANTSSIQQKTNPSIYY